jgi:hypothetical protein
MIQSFQSANRVWHFAEIFLVSKFHLAAQELVDWQNTHHAISIFKSHQSFIILDTEILDLLKHSKRPEDNPEYWKLINAYSFE